MLRYAIGTFSDTFITTVGIDYKYKYINLDDQRVRLDQGRRTRTPGAQRAVWSLTHSTFSHVMPWVGEGGGGEGRNQCMKGHSGG